MLSQIFDTHPLITLQQIQVDEADGVIPCGQELLATLRRLHGKTKLWRHVTPDDIASLESLIAQLERRSLSTNSSSKPMWGATDEKYILAALLPQKIEREIGSDTFPFDGIRLLLLIGFIRRRNPGTGKLRPETMSHALLQVVGRLTRPKGPNFARNHTFARLIDQALEAELPKDVTLLFTQLTLEEQVETKGMWPALQAVRSLIRLAFLPPDEEDESTDLVEQTSRTQRTTRKEPDVDDSSHILKDSTAANEWFAGERWIEDRDLAENGKTRQERRKSTERHHALFLRDAFIPGSKRVLLPIEHEAASLQILAIAKEAKTDNSGLLCRVSALVLHLVGETSFPISIVFYALSERGSSHIALDWVAGTWRSKIIAPENQWVVRPESSWIGVEDIPHYDDAHRVFEMPLSMRSLQLFTLLPPSCLPEANQQPEKISEQMRSEPTESIWGFSYVDVHDAVLKLEATLAQGLRRFTVARLRASLPAALIAEAGHPVLAQTLCHINGGWSENAQFYFSITTARFISMYTACSEPRVGPLAASPAHADQQLIAVSQAGTISRRTIGRWVENQVSKVQKGLWLDKRRNAITVDDWVNHVALVSEYTGLMFAQTSGHRMVTNGVSIHGRQFFISRQIAAISDKPQDEFHFRVSALGETFCNQLGHLKNLYASLIVDFSRKLQQQPDLKSTIEHVKAALDGSGPLFLQKSANSKTLEPLHRDTLLGVFPKNVQANFLRHYLVRRLSELEVPGIDVETQIGHDFLLKSFGAGWPESALKFAERLGPLLDRVLLDDGWILIKSSLATHDWRNHVLPTWDAVFLQHEQDRDELRMLALKRSEREKISLEQHHELNAIVRSSLRKVHPSLPLLGPPQKDLSLSKTELSLVRESIVGSFGPGATKARAAALRCLNDTLDEYTRDYGWTAARVSEPLPLPDPPPFITPAHLMAAVLVEQIRAVMYGIHLPRKGRRLRFPCHPDLHSSSSQKVDLVSRFVAELVFVVGITDVDALLSIISAVNQAFLARGHFHAVIIPVFRPSFQTDEKWSERRQQSVVLFGAAAILAMRLYQLLRQTKPPILPTTTHALLHAIERVLPKPLHALGNDRLSSYLRCVELATQLERPCPRPLSYTRTSSTSLRSDHMTAVFNDKTAFDFSSDWAATVERISKPSHTRSVQTELDDLKCLQGLIGEIAAEQVASHRGTLHKAFIAVAEAVDIPIFPGDESSFGARFAALRRRSSPLMHRFIATAAYLLQREKRFVAQPDIIKKDISPTYRLNERSVLSYMSCCQLLVIESGGRDVIDLDEAELETIYRNIIDKAGSKKHWMLDRLTEFHAVCDYTAHIAEVDWGEISVLVTRVRAESRPGFVSSSQYSAQRSLLRESAPLDVNTKTLDIFDSIYLASLVAMLMYWTGLRIGEALQIRFRDIQIVGGVVLLNIFKGQRGTLKSFAAGRLLNLTACIPSDELKEFLFFLSMLRDRQGSTYSSLNAIFATNGKELSTFTKRFVERLIGESLRLVTGCRDARPHWLRHTRFTTWLSSDFVPASTYQGITYGYDPMNRLAHASVRFLQVAMLAGHSSPEMTLAWYEHMRTLDLEEFATKLLKLLTSAEIAQLCGVTANRLRQRRFTHGGVEPSSKDIATYLAKSSGLPIALPTSFRRRPVKRSEPTRKAPITLAELPLLLGSIQKEESASGLKGRFRLSDDDLLELSLVILDYQINAADWMVSPSTLELVLSACGHSVPWLREATQSQSAHLQTGPVAELLSGCDAQLHGNSNENRSFLTVAQLYCLQTGLTSVTPIHEAALQHVAVYFGFESTALLLQHVKSRHLWAALLCLDLYARLSKSGSNRRNRLKALRERLSVN